MSIDIKQKFGAAIRSERAEQGISQEELADRAGLHRTYISDVERGMRNLSLGSIERLAAALELSVSTLFDRAGERAEPEVLVEILLIEDNARDVEMTLRAFRQAKIANPVHVLRDGIEALTYLFAAGADDGRTSHPLPGVILLDLYLPKIDGMEVLRRIKADKRTKHIPVVVLTGSNRERDLAECRRLGAESCIVKPVDFYNFTEITSRLRLEWVLKKEPKGATEREGRCENFAR